MAVHRIQTTFSGGWHSPDLYTRTDIDRYYTGLKKAVNVFINSKGVVTRRWGTEKVVGIDGDVIHTIDYSVKDNLRFLLFITRQKDLYVFNPNQSKEKNQYGEYVATIEKYPNFFSNYTEKQLKEIYYDSSLNTLLITHRDVPPSFISTSNIDNVEKSIKSFYIERINFSNLPQFDFEDEYSPIGEPFSVKFSILRSGVGPRPDDISYFTDHGFTGYLHNFLITSSSTKGSTEYNQNTHFRFGLNGEISKYIERGSVYEDNFIYKPEFLLIHIDNSFDETKDFDITIIERNSGYKFKYNKKILTKDKTLSGSFEGEYDGEEMLNLSKESRLTNTAEIPIINFCKYLSIELTKNFFKETCDFVFDDNAIYSFQESELNTLPIVVRYVSGDFGNNLILEVNFNNTFSKQVINSKYFDFVTKKDVKSNVNFEFCAWGCYTFESNIIKKVRIFAGNLNSSYYKMNAPYLSPEQVRAYYNYNDDDDLYTKVVSFDNDNEEYRISNNYSPWGLFFKVKRHIETSNSIKSMKNVYVNNGTRGLFIPFGGGSDPYNISPQLNPIPEGYGNVGFYMMTTLDQSQYVQNILGNMTSSGSYGSNKHPLQYPPYGLFAEGEDNLIRNTCFAINITIKNEDANEYTFDLDVTDERVLVGRDRKDVLKEPDLPTYRIKQGGTRLEDAWSERRGYPSKCAFIENSLLLANTKLIPNGIWISADGDSFNFREGRNETDSIFVRPMQTTLNKINHMVGNKSLQIFTAGTEHYNPSSLREIQLPQQSAYGAREDIKPVLLDGSTYFLDNNNNLRAFIYDDLEQSYKSMNVSIITDRELLKDIVKMKAVKYDDTNLIFLINKKGELIVYQSIRDENINNFVKWNSEKIKFIDVVEFDKDIYCVVKDGDNNYIARFNPEINLDLTTYNIYRDNICIPKDVVEKYKGSKTTLCNVKQNKFIYINTDIDKEDIEDYSYSFKLEQPVYLHGNNGSGFLTMEKTFTVFDLKRYGFDEQDGFNIGYHFDSIIETKDIAYDIGRGQEITKKKKFIEATLSLYETTGWNIYIKDYPFKYGGYSQINNGNFECNKITYDIKVRLTGYHDRVNIIVKQEYPVAGGSLQGIGLKIKV